MVRPFNTLLFNFSLIFLVFYRIYAEDGAIPSKSPFTPGRDPYLGRIKSVSIPPPHTPKTVKCSIARVENIKDGERMSLFLTPYSKSPMDEVINFNRIGSGPGSSPQEPLALVAKMSDLERSALDSEGRSGPSGLASAAAEHDTTSPDIQYRTFIQHSLTFLFVTSRLGSVLYALRHQL